MYEHRDPSQRDGSHDRWLERTRWTCLEWVLLGIAHKETLCRPSKLGPERAPMISPYAIVESKEVAADATIGEFAIVRNGAFIGRGAVIHPHAVIESGVSVGEGVEVFPGAYVGKAPKRVGAMARPIEFERFVHIGAGSSIGTHAVVYYDVRIGEHSLVGDAAVIREKCRVGNQVVLGHAVFLNYNTIVGDGTKMMSFCQSPGNVIIGYGVFLAPHVCMANDNALGRDGYSEVRVKGPVIHDRAVIGLGARLLPGVVIGEESVVGAASLVTRDVAPRTVVMGVPARVVRHLENGQ